MQRFLRSKQRTPKLTKREVPEFLETHQISVLGNLCTITLTTVVFSEIRLYKIQKEQGNALLHRLERNSVEQVQEVLLINFSSFNNYKPPNFHWFGLPPSLQQLLLLCFPRNSSAGGRFWKEMPPKRELPTLGTDKASD